MFKILKYIFYDLIRSKWTYIYFTFYLVLGFVLLFLNNDLSKAVITLMNIIVLLTPLIGTIFGVIYYYNSTEFTTLLLAQPLKRSTIFLGQYIGLSVALSLSLVVGLGIPFLAYGLMESDAFSNLITLLLIGTFLSFIFVGLAFNIALSSENKLKGFGLSILVWLFFAVIYDGIFLISLILFKDYPIDKFALAAISFNPIDLSRILILLKLDISALFGYTGAIFSKFFGSKLGLFLSFAFLSLWAIIPSLRIMYLARKKDF